MTKIAAPRKCGQCHKCLDGKTVNGWPVAATRMVICETCGNKRCPHASDCSLPCADSNEPGQSGSVYAEQKAAPQEEK